MPELSHEQIMELAREGGKQGAKELMEQQEYCGFRALGREVTPEQAKVFRNFLDDLNRNNIGVMMAALKVADSMASTIKRWIGFILLVGFLFLIILGIYFTLSLYSR